MLGFLNPWVILAAVVALGGSYAWGRHDGGKMAAADQAERAALVAEVEARAQKGAAEEIAKLTVQQVTIKQRVERTVREVPVYRDCRHDGRVMLDLNAALANKPVAAGN